MPIGGIRIISAPFWQRPFLMGCCSSHLEQLFNCGLLMTLLDLTGEISELPTGMLIAIPSTITAALVYRFLI